MFYSDQHPAKEVARKKAACSQSVKSARAIMLSVAMATVLSACGEWNSNHDRTTQNSAGQSGAAQTNEGGSVTEVTVTAESTSDQAIRTFAPSAQVDAAPVLAEVEQSSGPAAQNVRTSELSCPAQQAPGAVKTVLNHSSNPVLVPDHFMGMHRSLHVASWMTNAFSEIPAPQYNYGIVRNLRVEVDGQEERGFWSNIELAPGVYDWRYMDKWFAANAGHPVLYMIYGTPTFYQKYPNEPARWPSWRGIASPPSDAGHAALKRYAQAVKARYGSQVVAFEVWNEPTLPWTGGKASYDDRWSPEWGRANGQSAAPFFSGSASDLANIAFTLSSAQLGVPVLGAAFVDMWSSGATTVDRFLNAPVTLPGGWGRGKDHIQGLSTHFYDYSFAPERLAQHIDGYQAKLDSAGVGHLPIWGTETGGENGGVFNQYDWRAPLSIQRWVLIGASKKLQSLILYGHFGGNTPWKYLGGTTYNQDVIAALDNAYGIGGKTICDAAILQDGRVWVTTAQGKNFLI